MINKKFKILIPFAIILLLSGCFQQLPKCSSDEVVSIVEKSLNNDSRSVIISKDYIVELKADSNKGVSRTCSMYVNYDYKVDKNNIISSSFQKGFMDASSSGKKVEVQYEIILNDNGEKYFVNIIK